MSKTVPRVFRSRQRGTSEKKLEMRQKKEKKKHSCAATKEKKVVYL